MLNNRELASAIWLGIFAAFALSRYDVRTSLRDFVATASSWKIWLPVVALTAYVAMLLLASARLAFWSTGLTSDTFLWFVGTGLVLLFNANRASERGFFGRTALRTIEVSAFVAFFFNLFVFHLGIELVFVPLLFLLGGMSAVAGGQKQHAQVERIVDALLALIGLVVALYVVYRSITDWRVVAEWETLTEFLAPIWLTIGVLPFIFGLGAIATYETAFSRVNRAAGESTVRRRVKLALIRTLKLRLEDVSAFAGRWPQEAAEAPTFGQTLEVLRSYRASRREEERRVAEYEAGLVRFAGVDGTDDEGRRLDQREFKETKEVLHLLATAQMGWYRNDERYRADLLSVLESLNRPGKSGGSKP